MFLFQMQTALILKTAMTEINFFIAKIVYKKK